ncbi:hypothetical protein [Salinispora vitiensis]|uniref:hypothetical protein n=1 Tax=Salinispora vitiensis TaxID=999544 RepID=UPI00035D82C7|nr:hypothetical protein [Salinispora vitiensis]
MTLKVAEEALRADADMWDEVARVTDKAQEAAHALTLTEGELSWAGSTTSLQATYTEIQQKVVMLLREATRVYQDLSITLDQVANDYQADDQAAAQDFKGVWDARD